jgi:hypothetical protein
VKRSPDWFRQQSARAEAEYQRAVWGQPAARAPASSAQKVYPNLRTDSEWRTVTITRREPQPTPGSAASRIYPHLSRAGGN